VVERHRGKLDIASAPGDGTTVTVRLSAPDGQSPKK
jgi:signal transduction histidine kinase